MSPISDNWNKLSAQEKFEARFAELMSPSGVEFASPEVERAYKERVQIVKDAVRLKISVRVPVAPNVGFYPFAYAGVSAEEAMYDYERLGFALKKYHADFQPDSLASAPIYGPGQVFEILDYKLYRWPGHGVPPSSPYQCVEAEYMRAEDYDSFINDPSGFFMRTYLPRIFGALDPWQNLSPFTDILELPFIGGFMVPVGIPPVQEAFKKLIEAGAHSFEWIQTCLGIDGETISKQGIAPLMGGFTKAPFDTLGDTLRGTRAIMLDMFRQPEKLLTALDRLIPIAIDMGVRSCTTNHNPVAFIPLHKGADGFMSNKDFKTFYWPSLKAVIIGLIEEGIVPWLFVVPRDQWLPLPSVVILYRVIPY